MLLIVVKVKHRNLLHYKSHGHLLIFLPFTAFINCVGTEQNFAENLHVIGGSEEGYWKNGK
jgi:hypothetical protein